MADVNSDIELLSAWIQGEEKAFETIYKCYAVKLLAIAMQKTGDRNVAEELVQDTFLVLYNRKETLGELKSLMAFLYTVLKNQILDRYRREMVEQKYEVHLSYAFVEAEDSTESMMATKDLERLLSAEIEKLPAQCRNVFKLSRSEYLSNKAIALKLEISENTVEQHMRKALRILRGSVIKYMRCLLF